MATTLLMALDEMIAAHPGCRVSDGALNWNPASLRAVIEEETGDYKALGIYPASEERYVYCDGPSGGRPGVYRLYDDGVLGWVPLYEPRLPG